MGEEMQPKIYARRRDHYVFGNLCLEPMLGTGSASVMGYEYDQQ